MNGKTFINQYIKENPRKVLRTQFVSVSSTIRKNNKYSKQIINANNMLYPSIELVMDYEDYKHDENYKLGYFEQIEEYKPFFATLIKYALEENYTIVFLCGYREKKYNYLKMIQEYLDETFSFHMYDYKKLKKGKEKIQDFDYDDVLRLTNKVLKKAAKDKRDKMLSSESGRAKLFKSMSKSELKKELKGRDLYFKGMSRSEMIDVLDTFI